MHWQYLFDKTREGYFGQGISLHGDCIPLCERPICGGHPDRVSMSLFSDPLVVFGAGRRSSPSASPVNIRPHCQKHNGPQCRYFIHRTQGACEIPPSRKRSNFENIMILEESGLSFVASVCHCDTYQKLWLMLIS